MRKMGKMDKGRKQRLVEKEEDQTHRQACRIRGKEKKSNPTCLCTFVLLHERRILLLFRFPGVLFSWLDERQSESRDATDARKARWRRELGTRSQRLIIKCLLIPHWGNMHSYSNNTIEKN